MNAAALAVPAFALETFTDEAKAQQHCPKDIVVWLNLPTMIWHYKGQRWYANGAYACEKEAGAVGRGGRGMGSNSGLKIARKIAGDRIPRFSGNSYTGVRSRRIFAANRFGSWRLIERRMLGGTPHSCSAPLHLIGFLSCLTSASTQP